MPNLGQRDVFLVLLEDFWIARLNADKQKRISKTRNDMKESLVNIINSGLKIQAGFPRYKCQNIIHPLAVDAKIVIIEAVAPNRMVSGGMVNLAFDAGG